MILHKLMSAVVFAMIGATLFATYALVFDESRSRAFVQKFRSPAAKQKKEQHAVLEDMPGDKSRKRITFQPKAVTRLGIETTPLRDERVQRQRIMTGSVHGSGDNTQVHVLLAGKTDQPTPGATVGIRSTDATTAVLRARPAGSAGVEGARIALFKVDAPASGLADGQLVLVDVGIGNGGVRKIVPRGALVVDPKGAHWVFVAEKPNVFVRAPVTVDYVEGDHAYLLSGPPAGAAIAAVGVAEILGAEGRLGL